MKSKQILLSGILATIIILICNTSCEKEDSAKKNENEDENIETGTVTDIDGNVYLTVKIGSQRWMAENLKTIHFNNGVEIPNVTEGNTWQELSTPAYCWNNNDEVNHKETYGALYNWYACKKDNLCPAGWHVPSDSEWTQLKGFINSDGHSGAEGAALKSTSGWNDFGNGTDDYGFSALPGGFRYHAGYFSESGYCGYWWTCSEYNDEDAWRRIICYNEPDLERGHWLKTNGFSVRCIKD